MSIADRNRIEALEARVSALEQCLADLRAEIRKCLAAEPVPVQQAVRATLSRKHG